MNEWQHSAQPKFPLSHRRLCVLLLSRGRSGGGSAAEAGHALEILGHAIEYMADELNAGEGPVAAGNPRLEAIQMLMAINRRIYCECPEIPTWSERLSGWLHRRL